MFSLVGRATSSPSGVHGMSSAYHPQSLDGALTSKNCTLSATVRSVGSLHLLPAASDTVE